MSQQSYEAYYDVALELVKESGKILKVAPVGETVTKEPGTWWNLVTECDSKIEELLIKQLHQKFPTHKFIGEETSEKNHSIPELTNDPTWIIDPIDGTHNFIYGNPMSCISVALWVNKQPEIGIIYNPFAENLYTAQRGKGAYLNGKRIHTSKMRELAKCSVTIELSLAKVPSLRSYYMARTKTLIDNVTGLRSLGTAALSLCYVATGQTDAYHCEGLYAWDMAAGMLIVHEAGGYVCDLEGGELNLMKPRIIAACNKELAEGLVRILKEADDSVNNSKNCVS